MTRDEISGAFKPWLGRIADTGLRERVLDCFEKALERSAYDSMDGWRAMPFTLLAECKGITFLEHTLAVTAGAVGLAEAMREHFASVPFPIDMDRLIAGGLLHDVGKIMEIEPDGAGGYRKSRAGMCMRHPISGAALAYELGLPDELINCIGCHAKEGEGRPKVPETVLIHQADFATFDPLVMLQKGILIV